MDATYFTTLASGSSGNCALVSQGDTHILLDAGVSAKQITAGLAALGLTPAALSAILITHTHSDHVSGLPVLAKRTSAPIYATHDACLALCGRWGALQDPLQPLSPGMELSVGSLQVTAFPTPHDAPGSVGYRLSGPRGCVVLCTDLGHITDEVRHGVAGCDLLVCETNHDEDWVRAGPYPYYLKRRILGDHGHLSNEAGAELAALAVETGARTVVLAHLSQQNNAPARAYEVVCRRLRSMDCDPERDITLAVAPRGELSPRYEV